MCVYDRLSGGLFLFVIIADHHSPTGTVVLSTYYPLFSDWQLIAEASVEAFLCEPQGGRGQSDRDRVAAEWSRRRFPIPPEGSEAEQRSILEAIHRVENRRLRSRVWKSYWVRQHRSVTAW